MRFFSAAELAGANTIRLLRSLTLYVNANLLSLTAELAGAITFRLLRSLTLHYCDEFAFAYGLFMVTVGDGVLDVPLIWQNPF